MAKDRKNGMSSSMMILAAVSVILAIIVVYLFSQVTNLQGENAAMRDKLSEAAASVEAMEKRAELAEMYKPSWQAAVAELDEFQARILNGTQICTLLNGCKLKSPGAAYACNDLGNDSPTGGFTCTCDANCSVSWS